MTITSNQVNLRVDQPVEEDNRIARLLDEIDHGLTLQAYQLGAYDVAVYPEVGTGSILALSYLCLKLAGESGEVAEKLGKIMRDKNGHGTEEDRQSFKLELGDVLWYIASLANELNFSLEEVAQANLDKLNSRKERGVLGGSGDNR